MAVDAVHPEYAENLYLWEFCETFYKGSAAVKAAGDSLLPRLSGQTDAKYKAYKQRALVPGFVPRTTTALVGAIFRRDPHFKLPKAVEYLEKDATGTGVSLTALALKVIINVLTTGRTSLAVDMPEDGGDPYIVIYDADDLRNWSDESNNQFRVLEDCQLVSDPEDKFSLVLKGGYRELFIDTDGNYKINIWRAKKDQTQGLAIQYEIIETLEPTRAGRPMKYIPLVCVSPHSIEFEVSKPPILELCEVAHTSYQVTADWLNALHVVGSPTPYVAADIADTTTFTLNLGPDSALILPQGGTAGFLESKSDIGALDKALTKLEHLAAILGARLLDTQSSGGEADTATAAMIKEGASTAILSSIISATEQALIKCIEWAADWKQSSDTSVEVSLNKELVQSSIDANMLTALLQAYLQGGISLETFYKNLEEGGLTEPGVSVKDEVKRIQESLSLIKAANEAKSAGKSNISTLPVDNQTKV